MELQFRPAVRKAVPMLMSVAGTSGSGKTYTALLLAAGIAGPNGKVGFLDTENLRGSMYADSPGIVAALPQGYLIMDLTSPFTPARYIAAIDAAENAGIKVLIIDSGSHCWEGVGGCTEMAEADKGRWNRAKIQHRKYINRMLASSMHIILCLRAREKSKIIPAHESPTKKEQTISLGIMPVCEKNTPYEFFLSLQLDEKTHNATPLKVPEPLLHLFPPGKIKLLTKADGEAIRKWNDTGAAMPEADRLQQRARAAAETGMATYQAFWQSITAAQRKSLAGAHAELKALADQVDRESIEEVDRLPDAIEHSIGTQIRCKGVLYEVRDNDETYVWMPIQPTAGK